MDENTKTEELKLMGMTVDDIKELSVKKMIVICKEHEMAVDGKKPELRDRVMAIRFGRTKRYVGQETRCSVCGSQVSVKGKTTKQMDDGRTLVTRSIKCRGRHAHTYPLKEIV